jgi:hypothetical protein
MSLETLTPEVIELFKLLNNNKRYFENFIFDDIVLKLINKDLWTDNVKQLVTAKKLVTADKVNPSIISEFNVFLLTGNGHKQYLNYIKHKAKEIFENNIEWCTNSLKFFYAHSTFDEITFKDLDIEITSLAQFSNMLYQNQNDDLVKHRVITHISELYNKECKEQIILSYDNLNFIDLKIVNKK